MPPILIASGTLTAAANSQHLVATVAGSAYSLLWQVNRSNMASGDQTELRVYTKVVSADPYGVVFYDLFVGAPSSNDLVLTSLPLTMVNAAQFTLQQNSGTGRSYTWSVLGI